MQEVTKEERWGFIKDKKVTYSVQGNYPYTGLWKDLSGKVIAKDVPINGIKKFYVTTH